MPTPYKPCLCAKPRGTGRLYMGGQSCGECGRIIEAGRTPDQIRARVRARELEAERAGRVRAMGGLDPDRLNNPNVCGCGRPKAHTSTRCHLCARGL